MNGIGGDSTSHDLQALFEAGAVGGLTDGQLLDRFVAGREGAVFEAIIHRQGPMVWGVCRRVLGDHHDAEEAFQATFLVLARKAATVRPGDKVGPWLHGVAYRTALKARANRSKRRARERQVPDLPEPEAAPQEQPLDLRPQLDLELARLPEKYRAPIVLCELQGASHRDAADRLGWPIGTLSGRLSRGRALLARRLTRPGSTPSFSPMGALLASEGASAGLPARWVGPTARAACRVLSGRSTAAGMVSAEVLALADGVLTTMLISRIKTLAGLIAAGLALVAGGTAWAYRDRAEEAQAARPLAVKPPISPAPAQVTDDPKASYPFKIEADEVREFPELTVEYRDFRLKTGQVAVVPIASERGITGVMLIGNGSFRYATEGGKAIEGSCRAAMLRFNPGEQAAIVPLEKGKLVSDRGMAEMSRQLLQTAIRHCWQRNMDGGRKQEVLIPPKGAFAAVLYSREHGDLLISGDDRTATVFNFTDRKLLFEKK